MSSSTRMFVLAVLGSALVALAPALGADAGALPLGCWKITANGNLGTLCIPSLNADSTFSGTMTITGEAPNPVTGFWSSGPQQISFLRLPPAGAEMNPFNLQAFAAILFPADATNPTGPQVLAGSFNAYGPGGGAGTASNAFAWSAIRTSR